MPPIADDLNLLAKTPDLRALADIRLVTLEDGAGRGQRLLLGRNAAGLAFEVAVDRGFDLCALSLDGVELGWHSANGLRYPPVAPEAEGGYGFLRNFDGFIVTCGLDYYGPPREALSDRIVSPHLKRQLQVQHGSVWSLQAHLQGFGVDRTREEIWCEGVVRQTGAFAHVLELRRRISVPIGGTTISITDTVTNCGFSPAPHALLYHVNFGYPLLDEASEVTGDFGALAKQFAAVPRVPKPDVHEIVDRFSPMPAKGADVVRVGVFNPALRGGMGVELAYEHAVLPELLVWRSYQSGMFALGIEPGTGLPSIEDGTLGTPRLDPQQSASYRLEITAGRGAVPA